MKGNMVISILFLLACCSARSVPPPALVVCLLSFAGHGLAEQTSNHVSRAAPPTISRVTSSAESGQVVHLFGTGLDDPALKVRAWLPEQSEKAVLQAVVSGAIPRPPAQPPRDAAALKVYQATAQVASFEMPRAPGLPVAVLWAQTSAGTSNPWAVNRPQLMLLEENPVRPEQKTRVIGRNLRRGSGSAQILVRARSAKSRKTFPVEWFLQGGRTLFGKPYPSYELGLRFPALDPGEYELYVHNGSGGAYGWSLPLRFAVAAQRPPPRVLLAATFGVKGDGVADDTAAFRRAVEAAGKQTPCVLRFGPGVFQISGQVVVPRGVRFQGSGKGVTTLRNVPDKEFVGEFPEGLAGWTESGARNAGYEGPITPSPGYARDWWPYYQGSTVMFVLRSDSGFEDLSLEGCPPLDILCVVLDGDNSCDDIRLIRCRLVHPRPKCGLEDTRYEPGDNGVVVGGATRRFEIKHCEVSCTVFFLPAPDYHTDARIIGNRFAPIPRHAYDALSFKGMYRAILEDNLWTDGQRGPVFQSALYRSYLARNVVDHNGRGDNESETYLFETGGARNFVGNVTRATPTTLTCAGQKWTSGYWRRSVATVVAGGGLGQTRLITGNASDTVTLNQPWDVLPNSSSRICFSDAMAETIVVGNQDRYGGAAVQLWGACVGNVVDSHVSMNCQGIILWGYEKNEGSAILSPCYFNEIRNCRLTDRGAVLLWPARDKSTQPETFGTIFGTVIYRCDIVGAQAKPTHHYGPYWLWKWYGFDPEKSASIYLGDVTATVVQECHLQDATNAIRIGEGARATVLHHNTIQRVRTAVANTASDTVGVQETSEAE